LKPDVVSNINPNSLSKPIQKLSTAVSNINPKPVSDSISKPPDVIPTNLPYKIKCSTKNILYAKILMNNMDYTNAKNILNSCS